jgi:CheY-like chemotaxis protein
MASSTKGIRRVLVADDDPQIGAFVKAALQAAGHFVTLCRNGAEALKARAGGSFSVLVLDNLMPAKTGLEVLQELRDAGDELPVVLMSSHLSDETRETCAALACTSVLQKPFELSELRDAIERAVGRVNI